MPFKKTAKGKYRSPSGRTFSKKQVALYYATGGFKRMAKTGGTKHVIASKGGSL